MALPLRAAQERGQLNKPVCWEIKACALVCIFLLAPLIRWYQTALMEGQCFQYSVLKLFIKVNAGRKWKGKSSALFPSVTSAVSHIASLNALGWKGPQRSYYPTSLQPAGSAPTRSSCSEPHEVWLKMSQPHLWASCSSLSPLSLQRTFFYPALVYHVLTSLQVLVLLSFRRWMWTRKDVLQRGFWEVESIQRYYTRKHN